MINKGIGKAVTYSGLGMLDKVFGFFFGFLRSYIICVCIFSTITIVYNHEKWPLNLDESLTFPIVEKGSSYLIEEFPNKENYDDAKEKVQQKTADEMSSITGGLKLPPGFKMPI